MLSCLTSVTLKRNRRRWIGKIFNRDQIHNSYAHYLIKSFILNYFSSIKHTKQQVNQRIVTLNSDQFSNFHFPTLYLDSNHLNCKIINIYHQTERRNVDVFLQKRSVKVLPRTETILNKQPEGRHELKPNSFCQKKKKIFSLT